MILDFIRGFALDTDATGHWHDTYADAVCEVWPLTPSRKRAVAKFLRGGTTFGLSIQRCRDITPRAK